MAGARPLHRYIGQSGHLPMMGSLVASAGDGKASVTGQYQYAMFASDTRGIACMTNIVGPL